MVRIAKDLVAYFHPGLRRGSAPHGIGYYRSQAAQSQRAALSPVFRRLAC
jgi:hypothetical protein